jgi:hypothetical protein
MSTGGSNAVSVRGGSTGASNATVSINGSIDGCAGKVPSACSPISSDESCTPAADGDSTASTYGTFPFKGSASIKGCAFVEVATIAPSAPELRARLTPARSVQRAAFSAILRSVSWTLAGGATFCVVAIGRV